MDNFTYKPNTRPLEKKNPMYSASLMSLTILPVPENEKGRHQAVHMQGYPTSFHFD